MRNLHQLSKSLLISTHPAGYQNNPFQKTLSLLYSISVIFLPYLYQRYLKTDNTFIRWLPYVKSNGYWRMSCSIVMSIYSSTTVKYQAGYIAYTNRQFHFKRMLILNLLKGTFNLFEIIQSSFFIHIDLTILIPKIKQV